MRGLGFRVVGLLNLGLTVVGSEEGAAQFHCFRGCSGIPVF